MFSFFVKKHTEHPIDLSFIGVDMHSHLLPALDDGIQRVEEAVAFMKKMHSFGYQKLVCTPHILNGVHNNSPQTILPALEKMQEELIKQDVPVRLEAAAEYMVDHEFEMMIERKDPLLIFGDHYILIEMSYVAASPNIEKVIFQLKLEGLQPVLAHPERYNYYHHEFDRYVSLKDKGCLFQVNFLSLAGYYGTPVKQIAEKLMHYGIIDFIGTDMHHQNHLNALEKFASHKSARQMLQRYDFLNHTLLA